MSEQTSTGPATRGPLRRDRRSKVIAGVCGGLGRHLDIDPVIFRILFTVLSFVGGIGLLAYAFAWLFVPQQGTEQSEVHRMLTGSNPLLAVIAAIGLGLGTLASISALTNGVQNTWPLWMLAAATLGVLIWRGDIKLGRYGTARAPEQPPTWWQQPVGEAPDGSQGSQGATTGGGEPSTAAGAASPQDATPPGYAAYAAQSAGTEQASSWVDLSGLSGGGMLGGEPGGPPEGRRRRGYGGLVLASLLAATGVLGVLNAAGVISMNWLSGGAVVLMLLGGGMVVGGMFGKTTSLVPVGLVLAVPLILLAAVGVPLQGTVGNESWMPDSAAATATSYQLAVGDAELDLSNAAPGAGNSLKVNAQVGIGDLQIDVPSDVNVDVVVHDGVGDVEVLGELRSSRWHVNENFLLPAQGKADGTIVLDLKVGIGDVEVR